MSIVAEKISLLKKSITNKCTMQMSRGNDPEIWNFQEAI
jgi:hypothetical protein